MESLVKRTFAAVLASVALSACATKGPERLAGPALPKATWGELVGLSQDQIRTRLGLAATGETMASMGLWREDGALMVEIPDSDLVRQPCASPPKGYRARAVFNQGVSLIFRDGRFVEARKRAVGTPVMPAGDPVDVACRFDRAHSLGEELGDGQGALALLAVPLAPVIIPQVLADNAKTDKRRDVLAELQLGQAPPGGSAAFAASHPDVARIERDVDGEERLYLKASTMIGVQENVVTVRDGRIVSIRPWGYSASCLLREDLSLACGQTAVY